MNFELKTTAFGSVPLEKVDALIVLVASNFGAPAATRASDVTDSPLSGLIAAAMKLGDFETKAGKLLQLYGAEGFYAKRVVLVGAGDQSAVAVKKAVSAAMGTLKGLKNIKSVGLCFALPVQGATAEAAQTAQATISAAVVAAAEASYVYTTTKSKPEGRTITLVKLLMDNSQAVRVGFTHGVALVKGVELAKEWGNRPANHATPTLLANAAKALAKLPNIKCEVLGPKQVAKLGMGSFMAVAKGSEQELRFIELRYNGAAKTEAPVVLVGKGITFDTGGISIKPAAEMDEMKFDMCGAASVLGTFRALGELQPAINVVGLIAACENMPGSRAVKPGDVVTSMSGQTIEILNTDAEGRLVLCDALTFAERFKPRAVVDIATLTGACVIALGGVRSGLFSSDDALAAQLQAAGDAALDLCWRMPLDDDYAEGLKTNFADVANVAGRAGGAITAAKFLQRFAAKFPWAHLDIAGTAWKSGATKGSTGRPVGLLLNYVLGQVGTSLMTASILKPAPKPASKSTAKKTKTAA